MRTTAVGTTGSSLGSFLIGVDGMEPEVDLARIFFPFAVCLPGVDGAGDAGGGEARTAEAVAAIEASIDAEEETDCSDCNLL